MKPSQRKQNLWINSVDKIEAQDKANLKPTPWKALELHEPITYQSSLFPSDTHVTFKQVTSTPKHQFFHAEKATIELEL